MNSPRVLILETSSRRGQVALAEGSTVLARHSLDEARRHARDLAPTVAALLAQLHWKPRDLQAVVVSLGPGSYTGLRVGVMSAKTFAYATGCAIIGIETFAAIAASIPAACNRVDVLADAQKNNVYLQSFTHSDKGWQAANKLAILAFSDWLAQRETDAWVSGPGLVKWWPQIPAGVRIVDETLWEPRAESLLTLGLTRLAASGSDNALSLEPLYLRPSSAEEQWRAQGGAPC